ncbi:MAG TPA: hypothetical protein VFE28_14275 [Candidatus Krumholzibacteria bacterium]|nr:hypothetical protein [Candidatus Krumholzibacteria bacterium]
MGLAARQPRRQGRNRLKRRSGMAFVVIGVAFLAISLSGQRAFTALGLAFLAIGIARLVRR